MPAYAEGGVSAHLIAAAIDNNRQRLRTRRAKPSRNQPVLALVFASAAARARAQGRFHESRRRRRLPERRAVRQGAARALGVHGTMVKARRSPLGRVGVPAKYDRQARAAEPIAHHLGLIDLCAMLGVLRAERLGVCTPYWRADLRRPCCGDAASTAWNTPSRLGLA